MINIIKRCHRLIVLLIDSFCICISLLLAYELRFNFMPEQYLYMQFLFLLPLALVVKMIFFMIFGLYNEMWRKVSVNALRKIIIANSSALIVLIVLVYFVTQVAAVPRTVFLIDFFTCLCFMGGARLSYRMLMDFRNIRNLSSDSKKRVLIIGASFLGESLIREMHVDRFSKMVPVALLDDDKAKIGRVLHGVPVVGKIEDLLDAIQVRNVEMVIIAISNLVGKRLKDVLALCDEARDKFKVEYRIVPGARAILEGRISVSQIREVNVEDLLRREQVTIDTKKIGEFILDKTVLITGAAGSIGSEIVRQMLLYYPAKMVLLDRSENSLFFLQQELAGRRPGMHGNMKLHFLITDVCDAHKLNHVFEKFKPDVVLHAAAYKHVPMMEMNPEEAITNNVVSTLNIVKLSEQHGVKNFIMISTDKAVKPTSIMGASKRIAEMIVHSHAGKSSTIFSAVRFGNVINSNGSLVPVLLRQIRNGGPVTVTHPDIERFFMTIPEAVRLILQATVMSKGGEIFILDMGQPIKIRELAEDLIRLSGFIPHEQIEIVYTGLRPGEKMYEELWDTEEDPAQTDHPEIKMAVATAHTNGFSEKKVEELVKSAKMFNRQQMVKKVKEMVPSASVSEEMF